MRNPGNLGFIEFSGTHKSVDIYKSWESGLFLNSFLEVPYIYNIGCT